MFIKVIRREDGKVFETEEVAKVFSFLWGADVDDYCIVVINKYKNTLFLQSCVNPINDLEKMLNAFSGDS